MIYVMQGNAGPDRHDGRSDAFSDVPLLQRRIGRRVFVGDHQRNDGVGDHFRPLIRPTRASANQRAPHALRKSDSTEARRSSM